MAGDDSKQGMESLMWGAVYGGGIIIMLGLYGVIQERIMSEPYGTEFFRASVFLVLCNRLVAIVYALGMILAKREELANKAPLWKYLVIAFSNVAATWCQYEALKYVSFPVQMLGKSFKMMPVMIWSIIISGKKYGFKDWAIALGVTWGVTQFLLTGETKAKHADKGSSVYGLLLLLCFLACDGFTSTFQEKLFKEHKTSKYNQMLYVNSGSAVVSAGSLFASGSALQAMGFCGDHPDFVMHAGTLSAAAVSGQFFIYSLVKDNGALALAATMNLRQVLSILTSYILYSHPISLLQVLGLVLVFAALFYKTYHGYAKPNQKGAKSDTSGAKPQPLGKAGDTKEDAEPVEIEMRQTQMVSASPTRRQP
eukprot:CAMPEP_0170232300 /NCGR_PEP_ID=MMETSP0116_2-20130129/15890_1 /TAXON_ID=400756 /ORGANISM="Durinskia baltica, Strain CSIRO CS-38" /LENGTH=366 /DNA_ID=CAMNT_0010483083 /DNA_START=73 /DNA_END=1173 /DNA_ORIENTATION=+